LCQQTTRTKPAKALEGRLAGSALGSLFGRPTLTQVRLSRRATFTLFNGDTAPGRPTFSAFFDGAHSAFGLCANAEAGTADDNADTRRRGPFLNNPAIVSNERRLGAATNQLETEAT
jgi:hypothetical protein